MSKKLFDKAIVNEKDAISIYAFTSQIYTTKNLNKYFTLKNEDRKLKPKPFESSKIFVDN